MSIPSRFKWIEKEPGPLMILEALKLYGTIETPGSKNNAKIIAWAKEVGGSVKNVYKADSIPWCGLFMAVVAKRGKKEIPKDPLWALNWGTFGKHIDNPAFGDVLVFTRRTSSGAMAGHVGLYVAESATNFYVLGGNQSDAVNISPVSKKRLYTARRPNYINQPRNVKRYYLKSDGTFSTKN